MKTKNHFFQLFVFAFCLALVACAPTEKGDEAKGDAKESDQELEEAGALQAEITNYKEESSTEISENERLIQEFRDKIKEFGKEVKEDYEKQIAKLEEKNKELKSRMADYSEENREKWEEFKSEFKNDMKELGQAIRNFTIEEEK